MKNIKHFNAVVEDTLRNTPDTRDSDTLLYLTVCEKVNPVATGLSFNCVFTNLNVLGLPKPETVRRCRQKLQAVHPELRGTKEVAEGRYKAFKEVLDYVTE